MLIRYPAGQQSILKDLYQNARKSEKKSKVNYLSIKTLHICIYKSHGIKNYKGE